MSKIGERLDELMVDMQISGNNLAKALGVNKTAVHRWKREETKLYLSNAVALCDFFQCSLEFLTGRSDKKIDFTIRKCPPFYERLRDIMSKRSITRYHMTKCSKFKESYFYKWKKGTEPQIPTLIELADYLKVTLDYLVGREN